MSETDQMEEPDWERGQILEEHQVPLGRPPLRVWDINSNSTRYDRLVAAPSDETLHVMWILWAVIFGLIAIYVLVIFLAILVNRRTRKSPFNCYLLYLMVPDVIYTMSCSISCFLNVAAGHYKSEAACRWQSFYIIWGVGANQWLNAVVAWEIRKMLRASHIRKHYFPPTRKRVTINACLVYLYAGFIAMWPLLGIQWLPHTVQVQTGLVCVPIEYDLASTLFFWLVFTPFFMGIPTCLVAYVVWDVLYHKLLPPAGKRRVLGIYFFRIAMVFLIMWTPTIVCFYILNGLDPWAVWAASVWGHFQGFVSATVSLMKPDIMRAVRDFVRCKVCFFNPDGSTDEMYMSDKSSSNFSRFSGRMSQVFLGRRSLGQSSRDSSRFSLGIGSETELEDPAASIRVETETDPPEEYEDIPKQCEVTFQFLDEISAIHDNSGELELDPELSDVVEEDRSDLSGEQESSLDLPSSGEFKKESRPEAPFDLNSSSDTRSETVEATSTPKGTP